MYEGILVPTDDTEGSRRAFERGCQLAEEHDADLHLLHVVDTDRFGEPALSTAELIVDAQEDAGSELLRRLAGEARTHGVRTFAHNCHGEPVDEILRCIDDYDVDAVVIGERRPREESRIGPVARRALERTSVAVETA
jgi:nucleotide-binding universal stress UspA family protein